MPSTKERSFLSIIFVTILACLLYGITSGIRSNYGIILGGIIKNSGLSYDTVSFVIAISQLMFGLLQPFFGILALKKSNAFVLCLGSILVVCGLVLMPFSKNLWNLLLSLGILMPSGFGAISFGIIMGAITPILGQKAAAAVSGIISASSGIGSVILSPVINFMLEKFTFLDCMLALAIPTICLIPISIKLTQMKAIETIVVEKSNSIYSMLKAAFVCKSYYLLLFAFFTCGFHMAIIETHLFSHMITAGLSSSTAAYLFSIYGITTTLGSIFTGALCSHFSMKYVGGITFILRLFIIVGFILLPETVSSFAAFALLLGFTGAATVPPVAGMTNKLFGPACLGTLFGILFVSHQLGSFCSSWLGGISITLTNSYTSIWIASGLLSFLAGCACFIVKEPKNIK